MQLKLKRYRIVRDSYCGYEAQAWRLWFPIWIQIGFSNTHSTIEDAEAFIRIYADRVVKEVSFDE